MNSRCSLGHRSYKNYSLALQVGRHDFRRLESYEPGQWPLLVISPHSSLISTIRIFCYCENYATLLQVPSIKAWSVINSSHLFPGMGSCQFLCISFSVGNRCSKTEWLKEHKYSLSIIYTFMEICTYVKYTSNSRSTHGVCKCINSNNHLNQELGDTVDIGVVVLIQIYN